MAHVALLRLGDVAEERAGGADRGGRVAQAALVHVGKAELAAQPRRGGDELEPLGPALDHRVELFRQEVDDRALALGPEGEDGLAG